MLVKRKLSLSPEQITCYSRDPYFLLRYPRHNILCKSGILRTFALNNSAIFIDYKLYFHHHVDYIVPCHKVVEHNTDYFFLVFTKRKFPNAAHEHVSVFWNSLTSTYSIKLERIRRKFSTYVQIDCLRIIIHTVITMICLT
jgi:hypothetical protein